MNAALIEGLSKLTDAALRELIERLRRCTRLDQATLAHANREARRRRLKNRKDA